MKKTTVTTPERRYIFENLPHELIKLTITERYPDSFSRAPGKYDVLSTEVLNKAQARFAYDDCARWSLYDLKEATV